MNYRVTELHFHGFISDSEMKCGDELRKSNNQRTVWTSNILEEDLINTDLDRTYGQQIKIMFIPPLIKKKFADNESFGTKIVQFCVTFFD